MIERRIIVWLFAACWCVLLLIHNGGLSGLDGETFYQVAKSAVDKHRLDVGAGFNSTTGVGGLQYAKSSMGRTLARRFHQNGTGRREHDVHHGSTGRGRILAGAPASVFV